MRRGLYWNYLNDRSYENKRNVKKVEKALKYELTRCEVAAAIDKTAEDLKDAARRHDYIYSQMFNIKIFYWYVTKLRRSSQSGLVQVKDRNRATINDKERVKER